MRKDEISEGRGPCTIRVEDGLEMGRHSKMISRRFRLKFIVRETILSETTNGVVSSPGGKYFRISWCM